LVGQQLHFLPTLRNHIPKMLCIFLTGGAYAPYDTCMATPPGQSILHWQFVCGSLYSLADKT